MDIGRIRFLGFFNSAICAFRRQFQQSVLFLIGNKGENLSNKTITNYNEFHEAILFQGTKKRKIKSTPQLRSTFYQNL